MTRNASSRRGFLKSSSLAAAAVALRGSSLYSQASGQVDAHIDINPAEPIATISPEIYSHFIEHLGGVIYDGVWVGENSKIANVDGIRKDFIDTMKAVQVPVLRWPGGCFADSYDWRDGIGPRDKRPARAGFWKQQDSNQYGLHEFMRTCRAIGCKPYLAANLRTQPARDFYQEIEYCNAPAGDIPSNSAAPAMPDALASQRAANGDREPFNVDLWGVGNESWGCGGNLTPEEYAAEFRRFTAWTPSYSEVPLRLVAVGPNGDDVDWTSRLFKALYGNPERRHLWGLSIHYYTSGSPTKFAAGDALAFNDAEFYDLLTRGSLMDKVITDHWTAMGSAVSSSLSKGQPTVKFVVDEWGAWYGKGTELAPEYNLSQQSTMRDALLTGITFDIFQRHADKVAVAAVAQSINCIHSLMLAQGDKFCVTPTFHVFQMYLPHRGAQSIRAEFTAPSIPNPMGDTASQVGGNSYIGQLPPVKSLAGLSGSSSIKGKALTLTVVNPHLTRPMTTEIAVRGARVASAKGTVLAEKDVHAHNDFAHPDAVKPSTIATLNPSGGKLTHTFPPASVTSLEITLM
ncbi:alpha-N-arabinofuranosidase [Edaphobacter modestus]|uniref:non-reducing end alpha-L-arabinofuranosidase n=1 Tax=Edaphobacter modestus TaxID=388466 RepID=A0A4Q7YX64_9BACT|nr:alpha-L-arabinofuranosidase C-terminal domain-containing protein [Edaphobacter modestus]RZU41723.1 alpha-N-arabinofuranosidase [Edaphobacter modestus]